MSASKLLAGKCVVITGSSRGLGRAYAIAAAGHGAAVVVNGVERADVDEVLGVIEAAGGRAVGSTHSVDDPEEATQLIDTSVTEFGRIDALVNNAAIFPADYPEWEEDPSSLRRIVEVNVLGVMYCGVAAAKHMRKQGGGRIINVTSRAHYGSPGCAAYAGAKGAVASLTYAWAMDLASAGIRVNAISPFAHTDMTRERLASGPGPERATPLMTYLLSDLSGDMTGQNLRISDRFLGVCLPPRDGVMLEADRWDVASVAHAIDETLRDQRQPVGVTTMPPVVSAG